MTIDDQQKVPSQSPFFMLQGAKGMTPELQRLLSQLQINPIWINWFQRIKNRSDWVNQGELDTDTPTHVSTILTGLTALRLVASDGDKLLVSADISAWIDGTTNQIIITDDGDGTITLSIPQDINTTASPTFANITLTAKPTFAGITLTANLTFGEGDNIDCGTTTGTKIGTAANQKIAFFNSTPIVQPSHIADASTGHAITDPADAPADADALRDDLVLNAIPEIEAALDALGTKINSIITVLENLGLKASA